MPRRKRRQKNVNDDPNGNRRVTAKPTDPLAKETNPRPPVIEEDPGWSEFWRSIEDPTVANYCARTLMACVMDYNVAVRKIAPAQYATKMSECMVREGIDALTHSPAVKAQLEKMYEARGLDDKSKDAFVDLLWSWLRGDNMQLQVRAAALLGRGFIGEKVQVERPEDLPISGFDDGVRLLLSDAPGSNVAKVPLVVRSSPERLAGREGREPKKLTGVPPPTQNTPVPIPESLDDADSELIQ